MFNPNLTAPVSLLNHNHFILLLQLFLNQLWSRGGNGGNRSEGRMIMAWGILLHLGGQGGLLHFGVEEAWGQVE
jgi:hypothetical protein